MAHVSITTTQNIELNYDLASLGDRIVAFIIDYAIIAGYVITLLMITGFSNNYFGRGSAWVYILLMLPVTMYSLLSEIFLDGQSVGKRVMGIKVISTDGNPASLAQYLIRWLFRIVDFWLFGLVAGVIAIAVSEKHQRIGDIVAGTTLIKTKPRTALQQTLYVPVTADSYKVTYPEVTHLHDADMQLIKEVLLLVQKSGNPMPAINTMRKIEQVLHIQNRNHSPVEFLETLLQDYNHLTAQV